MFFHIVSCVGKKDVRGVWANGRPPSVESNGCAQTKQELESPEKVDGGYRRNPLIGVRNSSILSEIALENREGSD